MKKISIFCLGLILMLISQHAAAQLALSVTPTAQCLTASNSNFSVTTSPGGVTSYSWGVVAPTGGTVYAYSHTTTVGSNSSISYGACGVYTTYCWALSGTSVVATTTVANTVLCQPTISVNNATICSGASATLTASGATTYTWYPGNITGNVIVVSPTSSICYTVIGANSGGCTGAQLSCVSISSTPVTISSSGNTCAGGTVTLTASGGSSYSWSPGGMTGATVVVSPTVNTCYTVSAINSCGNTVTAVKCVTISAPAVSISGNSWACSGNSSNLTALGANSYTWSTGATGSVISVSAAGCYTVIGLTSGGCSNTASSCFTVFPSPTITVAGAGTICAGSSATLIASGSSASYSFVPGGANISSIVVTPTVSTCYTVASYMMASGNCYGSTQVCVIVAPHPTITIAASNTSVCPGSTAALVASGASTYTWAPGSVTGSALLVAPYANTCYTVHGQNAMGCSGSAVQCISVLPVVNPTISGTPTVCIGSSYTMGATGGTSYNWSTGATTASIAATATTGGVVGYWVTSTNANGCVGYAYDSVYVNPNCNIVWPGDANSDGVVDNTDVLEIGLIYGVTGAARTPGGNAYTGQYATTWMGNGSTGKNRCHVDCNGDGTIDNGDTVAIFNNYLLTHAFRNANSSFSNPDISIVAPAATAVAGDWNVFDIVLGSSSNAQSQLYGVAFDVQFDNSLVEPNSAYLTYPSSFLNASNQNVQFRKTNFTGGKIYAASVRTNGNDVSGTGTIAQLHLKLKPTTGVLNLNVLNTQKVGASGNKTQLNANPFSIPIEALSVGINALSLTADAIQLFPNPAKGQVMLQSSVSKEVAYSVIDLSGREVTKGTFVASKTINLDAFESGVYIIKAGSGANTVFKKLVVEK